MVKERKYKHEVIDGMKWCSYHKEYEPVENFYKSKFFKSGYYDVCREKCKSDAKEWSKNNVKKVKKANEEWNKNNSEKRKNYAKKWRKNNLEKSREITARWNKNNREKVRLKNRLQTKKMVRFEYILYNFYKLNKEQQILLWMHKDLKNMQKILNKI
jgi:hypothetical protein